ncbi:cation transporter [Actinoallomurus purpureus]|uniref:heavy-metal-associated domain-containing protein n=1 Tax=Actinoallomurus purpureus TaxID=478114 RepID=UPI002092FE5E|nr:cation transporter [Actinoallomurus purpureus]MCO6005520.1 cation transporter [Actinoallomurus purpureus]
MTSAEYKVKGMTCGHCVSAVTEEVGGIEGVTDVRVDLASGLVTVASTVPLDDKAVRDAVDEAGYEVVVS